MALRVSPRHDIQKCAPVVGQLIWPLGVWRDWRSLAFGAASAQLLARCRYLHPKGSRSSASPRSAAPVPYWPYPFARAAPAVGRRSPRRFSVAGFSLLATATPARLITESAAPLSGGTRVRRAAAVEPSPISSTGPLIAGRGLVCLPTLDPAADAKLSSRRSISARNAGSPFRTATDDLSEPSSGSVSGGVDGEPRPLVNLSTIVSSVLRRVRRDCVDVLASFATPPFSAAQ
ncbi:hypothetical protein MTO96_027095 [Rhipicephalus appendiculatus]